MSSIFPSVAHNSNHVTFLEPDLESPISLDELVKQLPNAIECSKQLVNDTSIEYGSNQDPVTKLFRYARY